MKPIINIESLTDFKGHNNGSFESKYADVGQKIGADSYEYFEGEN